jgi:hypothetical protein
MDDQTENSNSSMENEVENIDSQNDAPEQQEGETKEEYSDREKQYFARIKKLEEENKALRQQPNPSQSLSIEDTVYLAKADIAKEDLRDVLNYAEKMGVSIEDAHAHYKPILAERGEERKTAQATQTRSPRGVVKSSGEDYLRKAEQSGELPDSDAAMRDLARARLERRMKQQ